VIDRLPRSRKDHLVNSIAFRPGEPNTLYFSQASNSAMGDYDDTWGRAEGLLSAAILKLDLTKLPATLPLNAETSASQSVINAATAGSLTTSDGKYNPYATGAPLTIYASGIRNAYDLVWHSNGFLYAATNGSNYGGNTPASVQGTLRPDGKFYSDANPVVPATTNVVTQSDLLFRINPNVKINGKDYHGYFGHPNPRRGEYALNRGYPDNKKYPGTTTFDPNYQGVAYNFDVNKSPNGTLEYKSSTFNGALKGKLLVCRYSNNDDIIVLTPGADGNVDPHQGVRRLRQRHPGLSGFTDPLDVVEDPVTGNLYVIEFSETALEKAQLTLCRVPPGKLLVDNQDKFPAADQLTFSKVQNRSSVSGTPLNENHDAVTLRLHNKGIGMLRLQGLGISNGAFFKIDQINGVAYTSRLTAPDHRLGRLRRRAGAVRGGGPARQQRPGESAHRNADHHHQRPHAAHGQGDPAGPVAEVRSTATTNPTLPRCWAPLAWAPRPATRRPTPSTTPRWPGRTRSSRRTSCGPTGSKPVAVRQLAAYHNCCQTTGPDALGSQGGLYRGRRPAAPHRRGRPNAAAPQERRDQDRRQQQLQPHRALRPAHRGRIHRSAAQRVHRHGNRERRDLPDAGRTGVEGPRRGRQPHPQRLPVLARLPGEHGQLRLQRKPVLRVEPEAGNRHGLRFGAFGDAVHAELRHAAHQQHHALCPGT
jgi:hypothetical protein